MRSMTATVSATAFALALCLAVAAPVVAQEAPRPKIQLALLLDTSNSMDGLIDQAKAQLWRVVNELAIAKRGGQRPDLEVALIEYGNDRVPKADGYVRIVSPLTTDLDTISEKLFALTTNGGSEFCGQAIETATNQLAWSAETMDLKLLYIAGNEPFTQGPVDHRGACKAAITRGVIVNTIHCGPAATGIASKWQEGALLADGSYLAIDQNRAVVHVEAPQDAEIAKLGEQLNTTYLAYGAAGTSGGARQAEQDGNAVSVSLPNAVQRSAFKASAQYTNPSWDLVDALRDGAVDIEKLKPEELPEELRDLDPAERKAYVEAKRSERADLQARVKTLYAERERFVAEKRRALEEEAGADTLDTAILRSLRTQAERLSYTFER